MGKRCEDWLVDVNGSLCRWSVVGNAARKQLAAVDAESGDVAWNSRRA
jgi:hypothetical protein